MDSHGAVLRSEHSALYGAVLHRTWVGMACHFPGRPAKAPGGRPERGGTKQQKRGRQAARSTGGTYGTGSKPSRRAEKRGQPPPAGAGEPSRGPGRQAGAGGAGHRRVRAGGGVRRTVRLCRRAEHVLSQLYGERHRRRRADGLPGPGGAGGGSARPGADPEGRRDCARLRDRRGPGLHPGGVRRHRPRGHGADEERGLFGRRHPVSRLPFRQHQRRFRPLPAGRRHAGPGRGGPGGGFLPERTGRELRHLRQHRHRDQVPARPAGGRGAAAVGSGGRPGAAGRRAHGAGGLYRPARPGRHRPGDL